MMKFDTSGPCKAFMTIAWLWICTWTLSAQSAREVRVGEPCVMCSEPMDKSDLVRTHRGASVPVHAGHCEEVWEGDPTAHEGKLPQPRSALFQEEAGSKSAASGDWFLIGLYGASSVLCAAACASIAVRRRQAFGLWLVVGFVGNLVGLVLVYFCVPKGSEPFGLMKSSGALRKLPQTHAPRPCPECSGSVHPSATRCTVCGASFEALIPSELTFEATAASAGNTEARP